VGIFNIRSPRWVTGAEFRVCQFPWPSNESYFDFFLS
jgi:hypothetical protein